MESYGRIGRDIPFRIGVPPRPVIAVTGRTISVHRSSLLSLVKFDRVSRSKDQPGGG